ncbi:MAG: DUF4846 domain-containing protein [Bacteroidota bacterium]
MRLYLYLFFSVLVSACQPEQSSAQVPQAPVIEKQGKTIYTRFSPPEGYERSPIDSLSFGYYLRNFPLFPPDHSVHLFDGSLKYAQNLHAAVLKIDVGSRDLQQCADAIMRLWAEYNYEQKQFESIQFHFVSGFLADYPTWRSGNAISVRGNRVNWVPSTRSDGSYQSFRKYLNMVFSYAGTLSFAKELTPKSLHSLEIGDVFIQGGSPGHAVLVVDVAIHPQTGDKAFLLAQSYMPAQEIHILKNPTNSQMSPWYSLSDIRDQLRTPEWTFYATDLKEIDLQ